MNWKLIAKLSAIGAGTLSAGPAGAALGSTISHLLEHTPSDLGKVGEILENVLEHIGDATSHGANGGPVVDLEVQAYNNLFKGGLTLSPLSSADSGQLDMHDFPADLVTLPSNIVQSLSLYARP